MSSSSHNQIIRLELDDSIGAVTFVSVGATVSVGAVESFTAVSPVDTAEVEEDTSDSFVGVED